MRVFSDLSVFRDKEDNQISGIDGEGSIEVIPIFSLIGPDTVRIKTDVKLVRTMMVMKNSNSILFLIIIQEHL